MFNKIIFYILFSLIKSSLEYYASKLPQYGSVTVTGRSVYYLSLDNFKSKDTLYFEVSINNENKYIFNSISLGFWENNDYYIYNNYENFNLNISNSYSNKGNIYTFYFSYTLEENKKYLLILTQKLEYNTKLIQYTLKHVKEHANKKEGDIVGGIICIVVDVILFIALNIILCRCKKKNEELVPYTNANKSIYTNQPVFTQPQPLYDQSQTPAY